MESQNETQQGKKIKTNKMKWTWAEWALVAGLFLTLVLPALISLPGIWVRFNEQTAWVGDTIGGITSPISGLLGAYLVYKALKAQIDANEEIRKQFKEQKEDERYEQRSSNILDKILLLREDVKEFNINNTIKISSWINQTREVSGWSFIGANISGRDAVNEVFKNHSYKFPCHKYPIGPKLYADQIWLFVSRFMGLIDEIEKQEYTEEDRNYFIQVLGTCYYANFKSAFEAFRYVCNEDFRKCECGKEHNGLPGVLIQCNDHILEFLRRNNLIMGIIIT